MPGREEDGEWILPESTRWLEARTMDTSHGRFSMPVGSKGTKRLALLTRWVGLVWEGTLVPLYLEFSDVPTNRRGSLERRAA